MQIPPIFQGKQIYRTVTDKINLNGYINKYLMHLWKHTGTKSELPVGYYEKVKSYFDTTVTLVHVAIYRPCV